MRLAAGGRQQRRYPVHRDVHLLVAATGGNLFRPAQQQRDSDAALEQLGLRARERPCVGEPLAAVVIDSTILKKNTQRCQPFYRCSLRSAVFFESRIGTC